MAVGIFASWSNSSLISVVCTENCNNNNIEKTKQQQKQRFNNKASIVRANIYDVNRPWRLQVQPIWYRYALFRSCCCCLLLFYFVAWFDEYTLYKIEIQHLFLLARHAQIPWHLQFQFGFHAALFVCLAAHRTETLNGKGMKERNEQRLAHKHNERSNKVKCNGNRVTRVHKL